MNTNTFGFKIGDFQCYVICDDLVIDFRAWTGGSLIEGVTDQAQFAQAAFDFELDPNNPPLPVYNLLICTGGKNILIDAGSGKRHYPGLKEGMLPQLLNSLGYNAEDIDEIIITHSDNDHIGGIVNNNGQLEFPNAHYYLSAHSRDYWFTQEGRAQIAALHNWSKERIDYVWETYSAIQDQLTIVEYDVEFLPGFRFYPASGHRADHDVVKIDSSGETLINLVDCLIHPVVMANRDWYFIFDVDPQQSIETKEKMLEWCVLENALVFGTHFHFPAVGTIQRVDSKWEWHPTKVE